MKTKKGLKQVLAILLAFVTCLSAITMTEMDVKAQDSQAEYTQVADLSEVTAGGNYLLVAQTDSGYCALGTTIATKIDPVAVTVADGTISGNDLPIWTIAQTDDGVSLSNGTSYLAYKSSTDFKSSDEPYTWNVSEENEAGGLFRFTASGATTRAVAYSTSATGQKFGAYSTNNTSGYVFDLMVFKQAESDAAAGDDQGSTDAGDDQSGAGAGDDQGDTDAGDDEEDSDVEDVPGKTAVKITSVAALDKVYIYSVSEKEVMTAKANDTKLTGTAATVSENQLAVTDEMAELTVSIDEDGYYSFLTSDGKYLTSKETGNGLSFTDESSEYSLWTLEDAGDGCFYVKNVNASYNGNAQALEYYKGFTTYSAKTTDIYKFSFFKSGVADTSPNSGNYKTDTTVVERIAQWGGGGPYDTTVNATAIYGDRYASGDMLDTKAQFSIVANKTAGKPFQTSTSSTTGSTNYYMGGENIGQAAGDYMQFSVDTAGYGDMTLSFRLRATKAAPGAFQLQYSADGGNTFENFTDGEYSYAYTQYTSSGSNPVTGQGSITDGIAKTSLAPTYYISFNFDVPKGAENVENLLIRMVAGTERASGTGAVSGNIRIDSVVLEGSPIVDSSITGYVEVTPDGKEDQAAGTELTMNSATKGAVISYRFVNTATGEGEWETYDTENKAALPDTLPATLEVKASCDGKADSITRILTYAAGTVAPVKMTPNGGGVYISGESTEVQLSCETEGATIYYKTDDAEAYTEYTTPIVLEKGFNKTTVKAYAVKEGFQDSSVVSRTFTERNSDTFNIYFGQLHSHTSYSDGAGTAKEAFEHAREVENLDFLAVTDHSNSFDNADSASISDGSVSTEWTEGNQLAEQYTTDNFVGLFGYEMTWSNGLGHINTFNTPGFQSRTQSAYTTYSTALQNYYAALKTEPNSISQFNHPGTTFGDFSDFAYYDEEIDQLITIIEVGNGEGAIGSSGYFPSYEYYTRALDKGWHVAPTNNQDNHKGLWGDANTARSVVLADSLSEEDIYDAMRNYRVYATEDNDLSIMYTLDDNIMGSILEKSDVDDVSNIQVVLNDPTDDVIGKVEVIVNGGLSVAAKNVNASSDTVNFEVPSDYSYYYIKVTEADGDIAVTAPIWLGEVEAVGISDFTTDAVLPVQNQAVNLMLDLYNNENTDLNIEEITFTIDDEVIHRADLTDLSKVDKMGMASYTFSYTYGGLGQTEIYANVKGSINGVEKVYREQLKLNYVSADMVTRVIVDGTHYNDYVTGYYGGNMSNFASIAAENQVEVNVEKDKITAEMLEDCSLLVISAPARNSGTANAGSYTAKPFEDEFIELVTQYVKDGGSVVVCGLADYQDSKADNPENHTSAQLNKLLKAIGSTMLINDDEAYDEENNGGQAYRLYPENFNPESEWTKGIVDGQTYSQYSGCTVNIAGGSNDTVKEPQWIVKGFDSTYSIDSDKDGAGGVDKGNAVVLACQDTVYGGTIFAAGGVFLSDFEVKAEMDNIWDLPYANRTIAENILSAVKVELPLSTIAEMREGEMKEIFRIQGYTTSSRIEGNAFFDAIYLQDDTAGVTVFPIAEDGLEIGVKMEIVGYVDAYQGDKEIQVISYKILDDEPKKVYEPVKMSNKEAMDYSQNGGKLIQVQGEVVEVEYSSDGKGVNQFVVKDNKGDLAKVFIDGYILSSKTGENTLASVVKKGNIVSATGLLYMHPEGSSDESVAVLRVRDCEEVLLVQDNSGTTAPGTTAPGTTAPGTTTPGTTDQGTTDHESNQPSAGGEEEENVEEIKEDIKVTSLSLSGISKEIAAGKKIQLTVTVKPADATDQAVTWASSNTKYATVTSKGKVTLKEAGIGKTVTITATAKDGSGKKASYKIKIMKDVVEKVKITAPKKTVAAGKSLKLKATVTTTGKSVNNTLQWTSSNTKYATVSKSGKVTAKKAGKGKTVTITATATDGSGKKSSVKIKIE